ncbi:hypothetical protein LINPERHAP2_LOCUS16724, partial [Linum perenne]
FYKPWSKAIVVKVLERSFSFLIVKKCLEFLWAKAGRIQVSDVANSFFLVRFSDNDDYKRAAFGGSWKISVNRIGNYIGKTVQMDLATAEGDRDCYARICVEVDLTKPLLGKYIIENKELIEYESLGNIFFTCGFHGRKEDKCPQLVPTQPAPQSTEAAKTVDVTKGGDACGWMTAYRRNKKQSPKATVTNSKSGQGGSRTEALSDPPTDPIANIEPRD